MKHVILFVAIAISASVNAQTGVFKKAKNVLHSNKEESKEVAATTAKTQTTAAVSAPAATDLTLDQVIESALEKFTSIRGAKVEHDDYGFSGNTYNVTNCLAGSSKCVLRQSFDATLKIRLGAEKITWAEAEKIFREWEPKLMAIKSWGKTAVTFGSEVDKGLTIEVKADRNTSLGEKFKNVDVQLKTYYFSDDEFQVVLTIDTN